MNKEQLKQYADLKIEEKRIKKLIEELGPVIKEQILASGADKITTDFGNFTIGSRTVWKYSKAVKELEEKEKATGIAEKVESTSLTYTPPKEASEE